MAPAACQPVLGLFQDGFIHRPVTKSIFSGTYERFRLLLVEARKAATLSQADLANRLSRPQSFVSKYERGERRLDLVEFLDIARVLDLDTGEFIKRLGESPKRRRGRR